LVALHGVHESDHADSASQVLFAVGYYFDVLCTLNIDAAQYDGYLKHRYLHQLKKLDGFSDTALGSFRSGVASSGAGERSVAGQSDKIA
jgi:hypothetical protein